MQDKIAPGAHKPPNQPTIRKIATADLARRYRQFIPWEYQRSSEHQRNYMKAYGNNGSSIFYLISWLL